MKRVFVVTGSENCLKFLDNRSMEQCNFVLKQLQAGDSVIFSGGIVSKKQKGVSACAALMNYFYHHRDKRNIKEVMFFRENKSRTLLEGAERVIKKFRNHLRKTEQVIIVVPPGKKIRSLLIWQSLDFDVQVISVRNGWNGFGLISFIREFFAIANVYLYYLDMKFPEKMYRRRTKLSLA